MQNRRKCCFEVSRELNWELKTIHCPHTSPAMCGLRWLQGGGDRNLSDVSSSLAIASPPSYAKPLRQTVSIEVRCKSVCCKRNINSRRVMIHGIGAIRPRVNSIRLQETTTLSYLGNRSFVFLLDIDVEDTSKAVSHQDYSAEVRITEPGLMDRDRTVILYGKKV